MKWFPAVLGYCSAFVLCAITHVVGAKYEFNKEQLEQVATKMWGPGSEFYKKHSVVHGASGAHSSGLSGSSHQYPHHNGSHLRNGLHHHNMPGGGPGHTQRRRLHGLDSEHVPSGLAVGFYHIYASGATYRGIVQEQIDAFKNSGGIDVMDTVFYTTVGPGSSLNDRFNIDSEAAKYQHLYHFEEHGEELYTLGLLYRFCQAYPDAMALYFHDKGSYHNTRENEIMRRTLNCHTLNPQCYHALRTGRYDTCGFRASPTPHPHYSGNFFWATCRYVNTLVDPWSPYTNVTFSDINERVLSMCAGARGRFFAESWIGSAPAIRPADCIDASVDTSYLYGYFSLPPLEGLCSGKNGQYGTGQCALTSTWTNGSLFKDTFLKMKSFEYKSCSIDVTDEMVRRSMLWYGQQPLSYLTWIQGLLNAVDESKTIKDRQLVRLSTDRTLYMYTKADHCLHAFPNWNTFVKMGFDTDQVQVFLHVQLRLIPICAELPSL